MVAAACMPVANIPYNGEHRIRLCATVIIDNAIQQIDDFEAANFQEPAVLPFWIDIFFKHAHDVVLRAKLVLNDMALDPGVRYLLEGPDLGLRLEFLRVLPIF